MLCLQLNLLHRGEFFTDYTSYHLESWDFGAFRFRVSCAVEHYQVCGLKSTAHSQWSFLQSLWQTYGKSFTSSVYILVCVVCVLTYISEYSLYVCVTALRNSTTGRWYWLKGHINDKKRVGYLVRVKRNNGEDDTMQRTNDRQRVHRCPSV